VFCPSLVLSRPLLSAAVDLTTVGSISVLVFEPVRGTIPPRMPKALVLPPLSPVREAGQ
jgi:hypothetical protein